MLAGQFEENRLTPDELFSVLQMTIMVVVFVTVLLLFGHIAYERTEKT
jgi:hypothetical protein